MRVLVTGGAGFIGRRVVEALARSGHDTVVFDRTEGSDVRDPDQVRTVLEREGPFDAVCHQAGKVGLGVDVSDHPDYAAHNDLGTAVLLHQMAAAGITRLVLASSMVVYGEGAYTCDAHGSVSPGPRRVEQLDAGHFEPPCPVCDGQLRPTLLDEDAPLDPRNAYAASKVAKEHYASAWARATGGSVIALRYHNVYGPGLPQNTPYAGVAALFRSKLLGGESPRVFEDGAQRRDFVHVRDVADANVLALTSEPPPGFRAYNVGSGTVRTIGEVATAMATAVAGPEPVVTGEYRLGDVRHITASSERIAGELGWKAQVPFDTGIRELTA